MISEKDLIELEMRGDELLIQIAELEEILKQYEILVSYYENVVGGKVELLQAWCKKAVRLQSEANQFVSRAEKYVLCDYFSKDKAEFARERAYFCEQLKSFCDSFKTLTSTKPSTTFEEERKNRKYQVCGVPIADILEGKVKLPIQAKKEKSKKAPSSSQEDALPDIAQEV